MNLLAILLKTLLSKNTLSALAKKTGLTPAKLKKLIPLALPLLLKYLTSNASSQSGALSLLGALGQHTSKKSLPAQIEEADQVDGGKIIGHILGNNSASVMNSLAAQSGLNTNQVSSVLGSIAPALMSSMSAATLQKPTQKKKKKTGIDLSDGLDLKDIIGIYSALNQPQQAQQTATNPLLGLLGSFLG